MADALISKINELQKQTENTSEFPELSKYKPYFLITGLLFFYFTIYRPSIIKSKQIINNKIQTAVDYKKLFIWTILTSFPACIGYYYVKEVK